MKVTKDQVGRNREALVAAASRLFRERGLDGVGVSEICEAAGLTHGAFYRHFASKTDVVLAACSDAFLWRNGGARDGVAGDVRARFAKAYLTENHRDNPGAGCPVAGLAVDAGRGDEVVSKAFADGVERYLSTVSSLLSRDGERSGADEGDALEMLATLVGGLVIARAVSRGNPKLSTKVLKTLRDRLGRRAE